MVVDRIGSKVIITPNQNGCFVCCGPEDVELKMRQVWLNRDDFEMFHQDISPVDYEFFRTHVDTFKRMWTEQVKKSIWRTNSSLVCSLIIRCACIECL